jgi:hypothetical protein
VSEVVVADRVPPQDEERVGHQQPDGVLTIRAVPGGHAVGADGAVKPRQPGHQHDLNQDQISTDQTGDPSRGGEPVDQSME